MLWAICLDGCGHASGGGGGDGASADDAADAIPDDASRNGGMNDSGDRARSGPTC
jgi:hypothetical protein